MRLLIFAGAPGFEPGPFVLETNVLAVDTMPLYLNIILKNRLYGNNNNLPLKK